MTNSKAMKIAKSMNLVLQMPEDDSFVFALGDGEEQNNMEALANWIQQQVDLHDIAQHDHMLEQLLHRFHNKMRNLNVASDA